MHNFVMQFLSNTTKVSMMKRIFQIFQIIGNDPNDDPNDDPELSQTGAGEFSRAEHCWSHHNHNQPLKQKQIRLHLFIAVKC